MSGNTVYTMLLLGMGLRRFSVAPSSIPEIKKVCRTVTVARCREVAEHVMTLENARNIKNYLREELKKTVPNLVV
jgi:phosphotransferase system enzyme I (PtsI)